MAENRLLASIEEQMNFIREACKESPLDKEKITKINEAAKDLNKMITTLGDAEGGSPISRAVGLEERDPYAKGGSYEDFSPEAMPLEKVNPAELRRELYNILVSTKIGEKDLIQYSIEEHIPVEQQFFDWRNKIENNLKTNKKHSSDVEVLFIENIKKETIAFFKERITNPDYRQGEIYELWKIFINNSGKVNANDMNVIKELENDPSFKKTMAEKLANIEVKEKGVSATLRAWGKSKDWANFVNKIDSFAQDFFKFFGHGREKILDQKIEDIKKRGPKK